MIKLSSVTPTTGSSAAAMAWFQLSSVQSGAISAGPGAPERELQLLISTLLDHLPFPRAHHRFAASQRQRAIALLLLHRLIGVAMATSRRAAIADGRRERTAALSRDAQPRGAGRAGVPVGTAERARRRCEAESGRLALVGVGRRLERRQPGGRLVPRPAAAARAGRRGVGWLGGVAAA